MKYIQEANFLPVPEGTTADTHLADQLFARELTVYKVPYVRKPYDTRTQPASYTTAIRAHNLATNSLASHLQHAFPKSEPYIRYTDEFTGLGQNEVGALHHDMFAGSARRKPFVLSTEPFVHTTLSGGGLAFVAEMGSDPALAEQYQDMDCPSPHEEDHPNHPANLLLRGLVDTRLMQPEVYVTHVVAGDSLVVADNGRRSSWHRFDTEPELGRRVIRNSAICDTARPALQPQGFDSTLPVIQPHGVGGCQF